MTTTIGERIALIRGKKSQAAFARELGVNKNSIGNWERGDRTPDADLVRKLTMMGYNAHWVVTGEGPMLLQSKTPGVMEEPQAYVAENKGDRLTEEDLRQRKEYIDMLAQATGNMDQVWSALFYELMNDYRLGPNAMRRIKETLDTLKNMK